jgi:HD superfamily phosphohydrolase
MVLSGGTSAAEEYLTARLRMYQWAVYHHKIQQAAAGLRCGLHHELSGPDPDVAQFLDDLEYLADKKKLDPKEARPVFRRLADYTDGWWLHIFKIRLQDQKWIAANPIAERWIALFVYREHGPRSLWKTAFDLTAEERVALNALTEVDWHADIKLHDALDQLERQGVLVARLPFKPWKATTTAEGGQKSRLTVWNRKTKEGTPINQLSSLVASLDSVWEQSIHVLAFAAGQPITTDDITELKDDVITQLLTTQVSIDKTEKGSS